MSINKNRLKHFFGLDCSSNIRHIRKNIKPTGEKYSMNHKQPIKMTTNENDYKTLNKKKNPKREFLSLFKRLTYTHSSFQVWSDLIIMYACALSNAVDKSNYEEREKRYLKIINKYPRKEQEMFVELSAIIVMALEENPDQDFLGDIFMNLNLGSKGLGQFFTPYSVSKMTAKMTLSDISSQIRKRGYITIHDTCVGAGSMIIAAANEAKRQLEKEKLNFQNHILVVAQEIDEIAALMCYIQISLLGISGYVKVGNSLTDPIKSNDTTINYWFTPMYFSETWTYRKLFLGKTLL